jgi:hypothetical protein
MAITTIYPITILRLNGPGKFINKLIISFIVALRFFFAAQSFLVVAYSTFAVNRFNWKENQSVDIIAMGIIVFTGIIFSLILWELNYTVTKRMREKLRDPYLDRDKTWKEYAEPRWLPARIIFGTVIPVCLLLVWTGFGITTLLISRLPS